MEEKRIVLILKLACNWYTSFDDVIYYTPNISNRIVDLTIQRCLLGPNTIVLHVPDTIIITDLSHSGSGKTAGTGSSSFNTGPPPSSSPSLTEDSISEAIQFKTWRSSLFIGLLRYGIHVFLEI